MFQSSVERPRMLIIFILYRLRLSMHILCVLRPAETATYVILETLKRVSFSPFSELPSSVEK